MVMCGYIRFRIDELNVAFFRPYEMKEKKYQSLNVLQPHLQPSR